MMIETITAISTVVIALTALGFSFWQGYIQLRHQKLSVKPHLLINYDRRVSSNPEVSMKSNGLGPAVLKNYYWVVNSKELQLKTTSDYQELVQELGLSEFDCQFYCPDIGRHIEVGFDHMLLKFENIKNAEHHKLIVDQLNKSSIVLVFEDIYGDSWRELYELSYT